MSKIKLEKNPADARLNFYLLQEEISAFNHRMEKIDYNKATLREKPENVYNMRSIYNFTNLSEKECGFLAAKMMEIQQLSDEAFREICLSYYRKNDFLKKYNINGTSFEKKYIY